MSIFAGFDHIIWDWNGTLLDDLSEELDVVNEILARRGCQPISLDFHRQHFRLPISEYYAILGIDCRTETPDSIGQEFLALYRKHKVTSKLQPGARAALEAIRRSGKSQSILSAYLQAELEADLAFFGLSGFFSHIIGHESLFPLTKAENAKKLLGLTGIAREKILMVGDTLHDYEVAAELGIECVLVGNGHNSPDRFSECRARVVGSLDAL